MSNLNIPNLDRLISHLEGLPEEKFNMAYADPHHHECGTACCIGGHIGIINGTNYARAFEFLGDDMVVPYGHLFCPPGWINESNGNKQYPLSRAIRTLKHMRSEYLRTGSVVVDWDAPEPEAKPAWTAPKAVKQTKPALPAEIVRFLRPADLEVVS